MQEPGKVRRANTITEVVAGGSDSSRGGELSEPSAKKVTQEELRQSLNRFKERKEINFYEIRNFIEKAKEYFDPELFGEEAFNSVLARLDEVLDGKNILYSTQDLNKLLNFSNIPVKPVRRDLSFYERISKHPLLVLYQNLLNQTKKEWSSQQIFEVYESLREVGISREEIEDLVKRVVEEGEGRKIEEEERIGGEKIDEGIEESIVERVVEKVKEELFGDRVEEIERIKEELLLEIVARVKEELKEDTTMYPTEEAPHYFTEGVSVEDIVEKVKESMSLEDIVERVKENISLEDIVEKVKENLSIEDIVELVKESISVEDIVEKVKEDMSIEDIVERVKEEVQLGTESEGMKEAIKEELKEEILSEVQFPEDFTDKVQELETLLREIDPGKVDRLEELVSVLKEEIERLTEKVRALEEKLQERQNLSFSSSSAEEKKEEEEERILSAVASEGGEGEEKSKKKKKSGDMTTYMLYAGIGLVIFMLLIFLIT